MRSACLFLILTLLLTALAGAEDEYEFDVSKFEKKQFEFGGYIENTPAAIFFNTDSAMYRIKYHGWEGGSGPIENVSRMQLKGTYTQGSVRLYAETLTEAKTSPIGGTGAASLYEGYGSYRPSPSLSIDVGKRTMRWGKGYAWNPVAFLDKPKDPEDPELPREGLYTVSADFTKTFEHQLKTVTFTSALIPVYDGINGGFGETGRWYAAAKLYLLLHDTDIDLIALWGKGGGPWYGFDFSRNLTANLEVHGEYAWFNGRPVTLFDENLNQYKSTVTTQSYLIGARFLTPHDTTFIAEYYKNGPGLSAGAMDGFYTFVHGAYAHSRTTGDGSLLSRASSAQRAALTDVNPMQDYLYFKISQKDAFGRVYFTPSLNVIYNVNDRSLALFPELLYSPTTNLELRFRTVFNMGGQNTEFGEKAARVRAEFRVRYYF